MDSLESSESKGKFSIKPILLLLFLLFLFFTSRVYAEPFTVQTVNNFDLIIYSGDSLLIQHITQPQIISAFNITLNAVTGLNGSNARLDMYYATGVLRFTSQNSTNVSFERTQGLNIHVNGVWYGAGIVSFSPSEQIIIRWGFPGVDYISLSMGLIGIGIFIATPVYTVYQVKQKKNYMWIAYAIVMLAIGYGFVVGWLGG